MDASLDTNVIIHLYMASSQGLLFSGFEKLKVHEFIRYQEMENHAAVDVIELFDKDVEAGKIELVTAEYLKSIGMYRVFEAHVKEIEILFDPGDMGEVYAISLAKTLGCTSLITDILKNEVPIMH